MAQPDKYIYKKRKKKNQQYLLYQYGAISEEERCVLMSCTCMLSRVLCPKTRLNIIEKNNFELKKPKSRDYITFSKIY